MLTIPEQLEEAQKETGIEYRQIEPALFQIIKDRIKDNLGIVIGECSNFIWECFESGPTICGAFAWKHIENLILHKDCYLFFNQVDCRNAYWFQNSKDLCDMIGETYNCEVYVTNLAGTYMICYNHEEILCGCGEALEWIEKWKKSI